jgi:hypothetical protein
MKALMKPGLSLVVLAALIFLASFGVTFGQSEDGISELS